MIVLTRKSKLTIVLSVLLGVTGFALVNFTGLCRLQAVTLDGKNVDDFQKRLGLHSDANILDQPLDSLSSALLAKKGIVKVDMDYHLPHGISIRTNQFTPSCFILDSENGRLLGMTEEGRIVVIPETQQNWEHPTLVNLEPGRLYGYCRDPRVSMILPQLGRLEGANIDLYRLIVEIDFKDSRYLEVTISGLPQKLRVTADGCADQIDAFVQFVGKFGPDLAGASVIDMRFDDMIIQTGGGEQPHE